MSLIQTTQKSGYLYLSSWFTEYWQLSDSIVYILFEIPRTDSCTFCSGNIWNEICINVNNSHWERWDSVEFSYFAPFPFIRRKRYSDFSPRILIQAISIEHLSIVYNSWKNPFDQVFISYYKLNFSATCFRMFEQTRWLDRCMPVILSVFLSRKWDYLFI